MAAGRADNYDGHIRPSTTPKTMLASMPSVFSRPVSLVAALCATITSAASGTAADKFTVPDSPRHEYSFDANWKFAKEDKSKIDAQRSQRSTMPPGKPSAHRIRLTTSIASAPSFPTAAAIAARGKEPSGIASTLNCPPRARASAYYLCSMACVRPARCF